MMAEKSKPTRMPELRRNTAASRRTLPSRTEDPRRIEVAGELPEITFTPGRWATANRTRSGAAPSSSKIRSAEMRPGS